MYKYIIHTLQFEKYGRVLYNLDALNYHEDKLTIKALTANCNNSELSTTIPHIDDSSE